MSANEQNTIHVKNAKKSYGSKTVLNDFCMKVSRGCIYSLLGASGCGKTTLLSCLVGLKQVDSGEVYVLGGKPGTPESEVPGPAVGYMPQETALSVQFTIKETVYYFGRIHNMDEWLIKERFEMLKALLDLPPDDRQLKNCSGGQQRRVSLAVAMMHKPKLLILDEPTVGLDPVLRDNIWQLLLEMAEKEQTSIIITTHYIEEARKSHKVGLMREGKLLAEESPERLLQLFNTESLEEVFLILSKRQEGEGSKDLLHEHATYSVTTPPLESAEVVIPLPMRQKQLNKNANTFHLNTHHLKSLMSKYFTEIRRSVSSVVYALMFPILQIILFLNAVGRNPHDLKLAIVNDDIDYARCSNYTKNGTAVSYNVNNCHFTNLACRFLDEIMNPMFEMEYYDNLHDAFEDARHGEVAGVMHMLPNFSNAFSNRINDGHKVSDEDIDFSQIKVWLDMSNYEIGWLLKSRLLRLFQDFQISAFKDCNYFEQLGRIPIRFTFEFNMEEAEITECMLPGILMIIIFWSGATLTATIILTERLEGVWDRFTVAGVSPLEILLMHLFTQFVLMLIQTSELIIFVFVLYGQVYEGSLYIVFSFTLLQGISGMAFGLCVSAVSPNHTAAQLACNGFFLTLLLLCGIIWPLEGQPDCLRHFTEFLPFTVATVSLRQVIKKGYGWDKLLVWNGLSISIVWILIPMLISVFIIKATR